MERQFHYEIKHRFFESPNFSMFSEGEEVVIARITTKDAAKLLVEPLVLAIVNNLLPYHVENLMDLNDPCVSVTINDNEYKICYEELTAGIVTIEAICPECGCNPHDEPYCMEATHCPECGYVFQENE